jgi:hypothetical protein
MLYVAFLLEPGYSLQMARPCGCLADGSYSTVGCAPNRDAYVCRYGPSGRILCGHRCEPKRITG